MRNEKKPAPGSTGSGPKKDSALAKLAEKWRVIVYEISPTTLGIWLCGKPATWVRKIRQRFGTCDVRQRADVEVVIAWPANARTDELLEFVGAYKRRRLSSQHREKLAEANKKHRFRAGHRPRRANPDASERRSSREKPRNRAKAARNKATARPAPRTPRKSDRKADDARRDSRKRGEHD